MHAKIYVPTCTVGKIKPLVPTDFLAIQEYTGLPCEWKGYRTCFPPRKLEIIGDSDLVIHIFCWPGHVRVTTRTRDGYYYKCPVYYLYSQGMLPISWKQEWMWLIANMTSMLSV